MDNLTKIIREEIGKQYKSVRQFAFAVDVPLSTVNSALHNGVGGSSFDTVLRLCKVLGIKAIGDDAAFYLTDDTEKLLTQYAKLDDYGRHTIASVMQVEYDRCMELSKPDLAEHSSVNIWHLRSRTALIRYRNHLRRALRQAHQPVHQGSQEEDQPSHRKCRRVSGTGCRTSIGSCGKGDRPGQPSAHARDGSERCRRDWIGSCCRYPPELPWLIGNLLKYKTIVMTPGNQNNNSLGSFVFMIG